MLNEDVAAIDHTVCLTREWLEELGDRVGWNSNRDAMRLMRAVLTETRDRLPPAEMAGLSDGMPLLIRGMYFEGWQPGRPTIADGSAEAFEAAVARRLGTVGIFRGRPDIAAVFATLANRLPDDGPRKARRVLPPAVRRLWPAETVGERD